MNSEVNLIIIGDSAVGKSSLIHYLIKEQNQETYVIGTGSTLDNENVNIDCKGTKFNVWDSNSSQKVAEFKKIDFYKKAQGLLLVFDLTRPDTLQALDLWLEEIFHFLTPFFIILVGTKADLIDQLAIDDEEIEKFKEKWEILASFKTSTITGENVQEIFDIASMLAGSFAS